MYPLPRWEWGTPGVLCTADGCTEMLYGARWRWRESRYAEENEAIFAAPDRLAG